MRKRLKGSFTIEASMLLPIILFLVATIITVLFYWHDRNVLKGLAYEVATVGTERVGDVKELENYGMELLEGKMLWFPAATVRVKKEESQLQVAVWAEYRGMSVRVETSMPITTPEKTIRRKEYIDENILQK